MDVSDKLVQFIVKGRLQLLETQAMLATYYPTVHDKKCPACGFTPDTTSHVLGSCRAFRTMYIERHDRTVDHIHDQIMKCTGHKHNQILKNKCIIGPMFGAEPFLGIQHNKPDICIIDNRLKECTIVEVSHPYDAFIETCYNHKFDKYMELCLHIQESGYRCTIIVLVIGSLGLVHHRFVSGMCKIGFNKAVAKGIAKYLSISSSIGSRRVWRRRQR